MRKRIKGTLSREEDSRRCSSEHNTWTEPQPEHDLPERLSNPDGDRHSSIGSGRFDTIQTHSGVNEQILVEMRGFVVEIWHCNEIEVEGSMIRHCFSRVAEFGA